MTELEKANRTIDELMRINEELAGLNNSNETARQKIHELEKKLKQERELNSKYQRILENRKNIIKASMREILRDILDELDEREE